MARNTTITVDGDTRERVQAFKDAADFNSADDAVSELLRIASDEGYWNGDGDTATLATVERVEELEDKVETNTEAVKRLHQRLQAVEDGEDA